MFKKYCKILNTSERIFSKTFWLQLRQVMRLTGLRPSQETDKVRSDIADSVQTEYCSTFHCSSVRHRRDISHFSHI